MLKPFGWLCATETHSTVSTNFTWLVAIFPIFSVWILKRKNSKPTEKPIVHCPIWIWSMQHITTIYIERISGDLCQNQPLFHTQMVIKSILHSQIHSLSHQWLHKMMIFEWPIVRLSAPYFNSCHQCTNLQTNKKKYFGHYLLAPEHASSFDSILFYNN